MDRTRRLFEEVSDPVARPAPAAPGAAEAARRRARRAVAAWLSVLFALVVAMIAVGGLTRLTDSGLSITEWRPVTGAVPPLSEADWLSEFEKYRTSPEYRFQNRGMSLDEFRVIYWWEWGHRFLGRIIGLVWALGFLWFLVRRQIPPGWTGRLLLLGLLGGLQGAVGWWMVSSGLTGRMVDVASYRLAIHLGLAFVILGLIAWSVLTLRRDEVFLLQARRRRLAGMRAWAGVLVAVAFLQILLGALVAGLDAGRTYIDWPWMGGVFFPPEALERVPLWANFLENPAMTQFAHRMTGYALLVLGLVALLASRRSSHGGVRAAFGLASLALLAQIVLGIVTVLHAAPAALGLSHQILAVILFVLLLRARFAASYPEEERIARA